VELDDPYRYLPSLGEVDLHLIGEGRHEQLWTVLGAHVRRYDGPAGAVTGTSFAVWAPNAQGIRLTADFNFWDGRAHPMRSLGSSGVWEIFVPGVGPGTRYKFDICGRDGVWRQKADPMAFGTEVPPSTASVVVESTYQWQDAEWLVRRFEELPVPETEKSQLYDALRLPLRWKLNNLPLSRTRNWKSVRRVFYHHRPLITRGEVSLAQELAQQPPELTRLPRARLEPR
jgi:hypothetical protein